MTTIFETKSGSTYSLDHANRTIARLTGEGAPTGRIAAGRKFAEVTEIVVGKQVIITWGSDTQMLDDSYGEGLKITITSPVTKVTTEERS